MTTTKAAAYIAPSRSPLVTAAGNYNERELTGTSAGFSLIGRKTGAPGAARIFLISCIDRVAASGRLQWLDRRRRNGWNRRILVVAGRPGEGPFTIRFADLRHGVSRTVTSALPSRLRASWMEARVTKVARVSARFSNCLARRRFRPNQEKVRGSRSVAGAGWRSSPSACQYCAAARRVAPAGLLAPTAPAPHHAGRSDTHRPPAGKSDAAPPSISLLAITVRPATGNHDAAPCATTVWVRHLGSAGPDRAREKDLPRFPKMWGG
jgi:hypothetical protein